jgi:uncharacterized protein YcbK (DUF882 family)
LHEEAPPTGRIAGKGNKPSPSRFPQKTGISLMSDNAASAADTKPPASQALGRRALLGAAAGAVLATAFGNVAWAAPRGERNLVLYNPYTDEHFKGVYWHDGGYEPASLRRVDWLMRDFHQDKVRPIDPKLLDLLHRISLRLGTKRPIHILSGYRTPATDRLLRREGFEPAVHSEHLVAKAADICIDGISLSHLRRAALSLRAGGVGTYWHYRFVHVDVGPVRSW